MKHGTVRRLLLTKSSHDLAIDQQDIQTVGLRLQRRICITVERRPFDRVFGCLIIVEWHRLESQ